MKNHLGEREHIPFKYKLFLGLGNLGKLTISGTYGSLLTIFYQDYIGLSARWIGIASIIYAIWNAINDPIFGFLTDNTRSKLGRRIPYLRFTSPFLALTFFLVWMVPESASGITQFWWMLVIMLLYDTAYTIVGLNSVALLPEIAETDEGRSSIQIYTGLFGLLAYLFGFLIPEIFRPKVGDDASLLGLRVAMGILGLIGGGLVFAASYVLKEKPAISQSEKPLGLVDSVKETFKSRSFLIWVVENFMSTFCLSIVTGAIFYLADYVTQTSTIYLLAAIFVPMVLGIVFSKSIVNRFGIARTIQFYLLVAGIGLIGIFFLKPNILIYICLGIAGIGFGGTQILNDICVGQIADEDELRTGRRREGAFFGVNALVTKPAQSLAIFLTAYILEISGFITREQNLGQIFLDQPGSALFGIRAVVGLIPGVALLIGIIMLIFYPLKGAYLEEVQAKIQTLHRQKEENYRAKSLEEQVNLK